MQEMSLASEIFNDSAAVLQDGTGRFNYNAIDGMWVLITAFVVFSMQIGFALFEAGVVSQKNQVSILLKTCVDTICSGISFW